MPTGDRAEFEGQEVQCIGYGRLDHVYATMREKDAILNPLLFAV